MIFTTTNYVVSSVRYSCSNIFLSSRLPASFTVAATGYQHARFVDSSESSLYYGRIALCVRVLRAWSSRVPISRLLYPLYPHCSLTLTLLPFAILTIHNRIAEFLTAASYKPSMRGWPSCYFPVPSHSVFSRYFVVWYFDLTYDPWNVLRMAVVPKPRCDAAKSATRCEAASPGMSRVAPPPTTQTRVPYDNGRCVSVDDER